MTENKGIGVCRWEQWRDFSEDQKQWEIHRNLLMLNHRTGNIEKMVKVYAFTGGVVGGAVSVLSVFGFKLVVGM